jgi:UDP-N-acetylglucosamine 4-epimerase
MSVFSDVLITLQAREEAWLVTGAAGFIGSNIVETLLKHGQRVVGLDNFANGHRANLKDIEAQVGPAAWGRFRFIEGDIRDLETCRQACRGAVRVLHQAALGSVPRSINDPIATHQANVDGFLNLLVAAKDEGIRHFVFASSSSVYGDDPGLPKIEETVGCPLSPYALTKAIDEQYARIFAHTYGFRSIGLRYFNVFGRRQSPEGPYAAVMPKWIAALLKGDPCFIDGDGETSRDFCYVANAVQANILAATATREESWNQIYNVSFGGRTTLVELFDMIRLRLDRHQPGIADAKPTFRAFREGDIRHSLASTGKAARLLGYEPAYSVAQGLDEATAWYASQFK